MARKRSTQSIYLILQVVITFFYLAMIAHMGFILYQRYGFDFIYRMLRFLPQVVILISSLIPQIALRLRRKLHSQDGEIFPLLFTMVAIQSSLIIPEYTSITGVFIMDSHLLTILSRFSLLGTSALFLISSLRYYGFNTSRSGWYTICVLIFSLFLSIIAPTNSRQFYSSPALSSRYDVYLQIAIICIYFLTILTFIVSVIKDKTSTNIRRLIGFTLIIIGLYLAQVTIYLVPVIVSCVLYFSGIIVLTVNTKESF